MSVARQSGCGWIKERKHDLLQVLTVDKGQFSVLYLMELTNYLAVNQIQYA